MPELPEIHHLARQMDAALSGKTIACVDVRQPKCLNVTAEAFETRVLAHTIEQVDSRGKWVFVRLSGCANLLLNLGMGGEVRLLGKDEPAPDKYQALLRFTDGAALSIGFWWFGYLHVASDVELPAHKMTASLGLSPMRDDEFTFAEFNGLLIGRKGGIKALLMNQSFIAGIGNVYIQDILFDASVHPGRAISALSDAEKRKLFEAVRKNLRDAAELGGLKYERDLYGQEGQFESFRVGYREGQPCPSCGTTIVKQKVAGTASYLCPSCQR